MPESSTYGVSADRGSLRFEARAEKLPGNQVFRLETKVKALKEPWVIHQSFLNG